MQNPDPEMRFVTFWFDISVRPKLAFVNIIFMVSQMSFQTSGKLKSGMAIHYRAFVVKQFVGTPFMHRLMQIAILLKYIFENMEQCRFGVLQCYSYTYL